MLPMIIRSLLLFLLATSWRANADNSVIVHGSIAELIIDPHTQITNQTLIYGFQVQFAHDKWRIITTNEQSRAGPSNGIQPLWTLEHYYDGRDTYMLGQLPYRPDSARSTEAGPHDANQYGRVTAANGIPITADLVHRVLWLTFCSNEYFRRHSDLIMPSLHEPLPIVPPVRHERSFLRLQQMYSNVFVNIGRGFS